MYVERKRWVFLGLPFTFTKYTIKDDAVTIKRGFFTTIEDECYMYKIVDVRLTATLFEKMFGLGTITCFTGDTTDKELKLYHIKNSKIIKKYIFEASEAARLRRRTVNTLDIGSGAMDDIDSLNQ